jgi:Phosphotransferase enzyme family
MSELLRADYPTVEITEAKIEDVIWGAAGKVRLSMTYKNGGENAVLPPKLIVKSGFDRHPPEHDITYFSEMRSYRDIIPTLGVNVPKTYFAGLDPKRGQSVIVMEDLSLRNVRFNNVLTPLSYEEAASFLDLQARYHARSWNSPAFLKGGELSWVEEMHSGFIAGYVERVQQPDAWNFYMSLPRAAALPRKFKDRQKMAQAMRRLGQLHSLGPWCAVHGDLHVGNTFLQADGGPGVIDWFGRKAPWHHDFAYFLVSALDIADRRNWERALLSFYLRKLSLYGAENLQFDEAWLAYRRDIMYGLYIWTLNGDAEGEYQMEPMNIGNTSRFGMAALDHDTLELLLQ